MSRYKKINLHASYAIFDKENGGWTDRDKLEPKHFKKWVDFCKKRELGADFNPTFFSHSKCDPLTLSSPNEETRSFWIEHGKACIRISNYLAEELGQPCIMNIWTGDGYKNIPADRFAPRQRLYFENMLISGDWAAIHYRTIVQDKASGNKEAGSRMQFLRFAETGDGLKVTECWTK